VGDGHSVTRSREFLGYGQPDATVSAGYQHRSSHEESR
jgi:hypothetical protein